MILINEGITLAIIRTGGPELNRIMTYSVIAITIRYNRSKEDGKDVFRIGSDILCAKNNVFEGKSSVKSDIKLFVKIFDSENINEQKNWRKLRPVFPQVKI